MNLPTSVLSIALDVFCAKARNGKKRCSNLKGNRLKTTYGKLTQEIEKGVYDVKFDTSGNKITDDFDG